MPTTKLCITYCLKPNMYFEMWHLIWFYFYNFCNFIKLQIYAIFLFTSHAQKSTKSYYLCDIRCQRRNISKIAIHIKYILLKQKKALVSVMCTFTKKTRKKLRKSKITFPIGSFDCVKRIPRSFLEWFSICIKSNLFR